MSKKGRLLYLMMIGADISSFETNQFKERREKKHKRELERSCCGEQVGIEENINCWGSPGNRITKTSSPALTT